MVAARVVVHGDVQGVFFRDACRKEAVAAGVAGWVTNRSDGTVEAHFEGDQAGVARLCRWCETGSPQATVERVDVAPAEETGVPGFEVRG